MKLGNLDIKNFNLGENQVKKIYLGNDLVWQMSAGYDSSYQAILDYAISLGYTLPSDAQKLKQNQLVLDLKTSGAWDKLDTFANFATNGSSQFALIDWKRLSLMTAINSPAFTVNQGFEGNGTSSYINTNFVPSTALKYSLNNCSFGYYAYSVLNVSGFKINIGARNSGSSGLTYEVGNYAENLFINTNNALSGVLSNSSLNLGLRHFNRVSSAGSNYYNSTGLVGSNTNISGTLSSRAFFLFCLNNSGSAGFFSNTDMSFFFAGASLVSENNAFNLALTTYMNSL